MDRAWTLVQLHASLKQQMAPAPAPSLPTLKSWSRMGALPAKAGLQEAADLVLAKIREGTLRVRGPRAQTGNRQTSSAKHRNPEHETAVPQGAWPSTEGRLGHAAACPHCAESQRTLRQALQAIEQADAVRKHLLLQWDALRQHEAAAREGAAPARHDSAKDAPAGVDFLEWQRLQARLARMEQLLQQLAQAALGTR